MEGGVLHIGGSKLRVQFIDFDFELIDLVPVPIALILDDLVNVACDLIKVRLDIPCMIAVPIPPDLALDDPPEQRVKFAARRSHRDSRQAPLANRCRCCATG